MGEGEELAAAAAAPTPVADASVSMSTSGNGEGEEPAAAAAALKPAESERVMEVELAPEGAAACMNAGPQSGAAGGTLSPPAPALRGAGGGVYSPAQVSEEESEEDAVARMLRSAVRAGRTDAARSKGFEAVLLGAARPYGTDLSEALAHRFSPARAVAADTPGAVVRVAWGPKGTHSVWYMPSLRALVDPAVKDAAAAAAARGTFALLFVGCGGRPDTLALADGHASLAAPAGAAAWQPVEQAVTAAWGSPRAARAWAWGTSAPGPLLPGTVRWLDKYRAVVEERAKAEHAAQQAGERSAKSLELRAAGVMLARFMQHQLLHAPHSAAPSGLRRRAAGKAITAMLCASDNPDRKDKPRYWDVAGIVENAQWERVTREQSGFDSWQPLPPPAPGRLKLVCARRLGEAYLAAVGEGSVPEDHAIWTALKEIRGHTQALAPHLTEALAAAHVAGEPLWLFDRDKVEPSPEGPQLELFLAEIDRIVAQGSWRELSEDEQRDPAQCAAVAYLGCVWKSALARTEEEEAAVLADDQPALARLALARAQQVLQALDASLKGAVAAGADAAALHPAVRLEQVMAEVAGAILKTRPVARFQAFSRGDPRLGLEPNGVLPSGCTTPQLIELLVGATRKSLLARHDAVDFFYSISLSLLGRALTCLAFKDPRTGRLRVFQLLVLCMGQSSAPAVAELVSSLVALIANARGAAQGTCAGWAALCDDFIAVAEEGDLRRASEILLQLMTEVGITESEKKRVWGSQGECLGKSFDLGKGMVCVPPARLHRYLVNLHVALEALKSDNSTVRAAVTKDMLARITGTLAWIAETTISGALHLGGLYAVTARGKSIQRCRERVIDDLQWWADEAAAGRLRTELALGESPVHTGSVDASDVALGAVTPEGALWRALEPVERAMSSTRRELRACEMLLQERGPAIEGSTLVVTMDSLSAVLSINKGRLKGKGGTRDLRRLYALMERHRVHVVALWIPREYNRKPDAVSKCASLADFNAWAAARGWSRTAAQ
jgi:hypothetical protein